MAEQAADLGRRAVTVAGDLNDPNCWSSIVDEAVAGLGRLDILVNNASIFLTDKPDTLEAFDLQLWETMLRINLIAPIGLCHYAAPHLRAHGMGKIINLLDVSSERPWPGHLAYCVSKAGLAAMTKGLALSLAPEIRVCGVAPGIAVFPEQYSTELREKLTGYVPLDRAGTPEEVARLVRFLVESGNYITGETIRIDGGRNLV